MTEFHVIAGPPCSGKTTYIRKHARVYDIVLEVDELAAACRGPLVLGLILRNSVLKHIQERPELAPSGVVWVSSASLSQARSLAARLPDSTLTILDTSKDVCLDRASLRPGGIEYWQSRIEEWFSDLAGN